MLFSGETFYNFQGKTHMLFLERNKEPEREPVSTIG